MTLGLSPKLYPAVVAMLIGLILLAFGQSEAGVGVLLAGSGQLGLGYALPPGEVVSGEVGPGSDAFLEAGVVKRLGSEAADVPYE